MAMSTTESSCALSDQNARIDQPPKYFSIGWITHSVEEILIDINWRHVSFKILALSWTALILWLGWWSVSSFSSIFITYNEPDIAQKTLDLSTYFDGFDGTSECAIDATDLYVLPLQHTHETVFCPNRQRLLQAMSEGGRIGFDAPYMPKGCHYRWFSPSEICSILDRFDSFVFIGDSFLQTIYSGLAILLRNDLASGALQQDKTEDSNLRHECRCNNQFVKSACAGNYVASSNEVDDLICKRTPHTFLKVETGVMSDAIVQQFTTLVPKVPRSNYKPVPIISSISPSSASKKEAATFLVKTLALADASKRNTPILWIGPTAAGHIDIRGRKGNQEIWDFSQHMAKLSADNDIEVLGLWNMTVQASSWDGIHFGEKVAIVQAMMIVNWLSRLESS